MEVNDTTVELVVAYLWRGSRSSISSVAPPLLGTRLIHNLQVPCSRCMSKQIVCQTRATRRSSQAPSRRGNNVPRPHSERALHASAAFHISQLSSPPHDSTCES